MADGFALDSGIDPEKLAVDYAARGRIRIEPFLSADSAAALADHLQERIDWRLALKGEAHQVFEFDQAARAAMSSGQARALEKLAAPDRPGFRYLYDRIWAVHAEKAREEGTLLAAFADFLRSEPVLDLLGRVAGARDVASADAQATRYAPGHFLTIHDDAEPTRTRRIAYVLGLTQSWRTEWGGLLMFHDRKGDVVEAWRPRFNALALFSVPQLHSVSAVVPSAPKPRCSVSGWLMAPPAAEGS
ncbi:MAG: SM-20-related protein [Sphingomonadales bacterium]|nr:SM-20-related protein [Sphingomonadales bacterium]